MLYDQFGPEYTSLNIFFGIFGTLDQKVLPTHTLTTSPKNLQYFENVPDSNLLIDPWIGQSQRIC